MYEKTEKPKNKFNMREARNRNAARKTSSPLSKYDFVPSDLKAKTQKPTSKKTCRPSASTNVFWPMRRSKRVTLTQPEASRILLQARIDFRV